MDEVTLSDYRCFHAEQRVRLAPLTILVGENSTGKTSFLAMVRALWQVAYQDAIPDFKAPPYDLGSFDEVVHHRGRRAGRAETFGAGFRATVDGHDNRYPLCFDVTFAKLGSAPVPVRRRVSRGMVSVEATQTGDMFEVDFETANGRWRTERRTPSRSEDPSLTPMFIAGHDLHRVAQYRLPHLCGWPTDIRADHAPHKLTKPTSRGLAADSVTHQPNGLRDRTQPVFLDQREQL